MILSSALKQRLNQEIDTIERRILKLEIDDENFSDWFDAQLFNQEAANPHDYVKELRANVIALNQATQASHSQWLSERIAHQLSALHQATRWFEQR